MRPVALALAALITAGCSSTPTELQPSPWASDYEPHESMDMTPREYYGHVSREFERFSEKAGRTWKGLQDLWKNGSSCLEVHGDIGDLLETDLRKLNYQIRVLEESIMESKDLDSPACESMKQDIIFLRREKIKVNERLAEYNESLDREFDARTDALTEMHKSALTKAMQYEAEVLRVEREYGFGGEE